MGVVDVRHRDNSRQTTVQAGGDLDLGGFPPGVKGVIETGLNSNSVPPVLEFNQPALFGSMPHTVHARIDRIARHVSASSRRETGATADVSAMQASPDVRPPITSHALDTARGTPAEGLPLTLERRTEGGAWVALGNTTTNHDGRAPGLMPSISSAEEFVKGTYRVTFNTEEYFRLTGSPCFYPEVSVVFRVEDVSQHFHIPLLISPYGYSTYRGS